MKKLSTIILAIALSGCTTIHFDNGEVQKTQNTQGMIKIEKWHHIVALDLYELSEPIDLNKECGEQEWVTVKSEKSLINALADSVTNAVGPIWYPKTATITCGDK